MGSKSIFVGRKSKFVGRKSNFVGSIFVGSELIKICGHFEVKFVGTQKYMPIQCNTINLIIKKTQVIILIDYKI